jgi:Protein of unknown function (DUF2855)
VARRFTLRPVPQLLVRRDDPAACELVEGESREAHLDEGAAQLRIERFALTTNNVSYADFGDRLGYWRLFPAPKGWGSIPAWGYARVVRSRAAEVTEGQRVFGVVPMGSYATVRPKAHQLGFVDAAPHRQDLSPIYNLYDRVEGEGDEAELVMRPLLGTAVVLDLALAEDAWDGSATAVVTSASSKTAYGLAHLLRRRSVQTIGLTSERHREWVASLALYDDVLTYAQADDLDVAGGAVLVDFSGDRALVGALHERLGDALKRSVHVGFTHREAADDQLALAGPAGDFFFAPDEMARRGADLARAYAEAWAGFAPLVERAMRIERVTDADALVAAYRGLVRGRSDPAVGYVASLEP